MAIRVGVNSGEIVVRAIGNDLHMDFTVVGQTAHLASRMEQLAKPGSVLTTADTLQLAEGYIAVNSLGPMPVKGLAEPVQVYEVTGDRHRTNAPPGGRRTRPDAFRRSGHRTGAAAPRAAARRRRSRSGGGDHRRGGAGKSRLLHEFLHSPHTADWLILESHSASYGRATPYLPVIELLRRYFEINAHDSTRSIREKVSDRILTLDPAMQDSLPPLLDLLDALDGDHPFRSVDPSRHRQ